MKIGRSKKSANCCLTAQKRKITLGKKTIRPKAINHSVKLDPIRIKADKTRPNLPIFRTQSGPCKRRWPRTEKLSAFPRGQRRENWSKPGQKPPKSPQQHRQQPRRRPQRRDLRSCSRGGASPRRRPRRCLGSRSGASRTVLSKGARQICAIVTLASENTTDRAFAGLTVLPILFSTSDIYGCGLCESYFLNVVKLAWRHK